MHPIQISRHMHSMGDKRDIFAGLTWKKEIRSLGDPHVHFNSLPKHNICVVNRYSNDYKLTSFSQSTQTWRWRMQEEQKQYAKNNKMRCDV